MSVALTASVKATDSKSVSSFNHFHFEKITGQLTHLDSSSPGYALAHKNELFLQNAQGLNKVWEYLKSSKYTQNREQKSTTISMHLL